MTQVNSPFLLSKIRPSSKEQAGEYRAQLDNYFFQLERMLQQLYQRTGGGIDAVQENEGLITSTAYLMSIANQGLYEVEELSAYNYARHQAELDKLKDEVDEVASLSAAKCRSDDIRDRLDEIEARQVYIVGALDGIHKQLKELEDLSYGYNA